MFDGTVYVFGTDRLSFINSHRFERSTTMSDIKVTILIEN